MGYPSPKFCGAGKEIHGYYDSKKYSCCPKCVESRTKKRVVDETKSLRNQLKAAERRIKELNLGDGRPPLSHVLIPCDAVTLPCSGCCGVLEVQEKAAELKCNECGRRFIVAERAKEKP